MPEMPPPTASAAMPLADELERLHERASKLAEDVMHAGAGQPMPWFVSAPPGWCVGRFEREVDAQLFYVLRNALPAIIAVLRAAAGCAADAASEGATDEQRQPCEAQTWEEFIEWYRPVTLRGNRQWSLEIERHMKVAWDHQQRTINALDTISHAKGAELERVAALVGYAGAKPGGLRDAVEAVLQAVRPAAPAPTLQEALDATIQLLPQHIYLYGRPATTLLSDLRDRLAAAASSPAAQEAP